MLDAMKPACAALLLGISVALLGVACGSSGDDPAPASPAAAASAAPTTTAEPAPSATSTAAATPTGTPAATATPSSPPSSSTVTPATDGFPIRVLFSRHPESDSDPSAVFPVDRVAPDSGVARYAIGQVLEGPTAEEAAAGFFSAWTNFFYADDSDCGGDRFEIVLDGGVATVRFCVTVILLGVVADAQALSALTATLEQFPTIERVVMLNRAGDCMFDLSGLNLCLEGN